jgi:hypothetical protein
VALKGFSVAIEWGESGKYDKAPQSPVVKRAVALVRERKSAITCPLSSYHFHGRVYFVRMFYSSIMVSFLVAFQAERCSLNVELGVVLTDES